MTPSGRRSAADPLDDVGTRRRIGEALEAAGAGDLLGHAHEPAPRRARQRTADADAPHAELAEVAHRELARAPHQEVDRLRRHALDDGGDLLARLDAWRVQTVGAGIREGFEAADGLGHVRPVADEALAAPREQHVAAG